MWDAAMRKLLWVDIKSDRLHLTDPEGGSGGTIAVPGHPGCVVVDQSGSLLAAVEHRLLRIPPGGGGLESLCELEDDPRLRFNDGKCDPAGRLWVGTMDRREEEPLGCLYRVSDGGAIAAMQRGVTVSNGLGWSPAGDRMYYIDSPTRRVWAYDFDMASGEIGGRRVLAVFGETDGFPDGMAVDEEGCLWVAFWGGAKLLRIHPADGRVLQQIDFPASKVTSCAFGGEHLDQLFVTTARVGLDDEEEPLAGRLFVCQPGVSGIASSRFLGS